MKVIYDVKIPPDFLPIIQKRLALILPHFPGWVQEIVIYYDLNNPQGDTLACKSNYNYRYVELYIYEEWFHPNETNWSTALWHELMHVVFSPYTYVVERAISLLDEPTLKKHIEQEIADAEEFVAQDFAHLIDNLTRPLK